MGILSDNKNKTGASTLNGGGILRKARETKYNNTKTVSRLKAATVHENRLSPKLEQPAIQPTAKEKLMESRLTPVVDKSKTPIDQRLHIGGDALKSDSRSYIGMNILPAYKEDDPLAKVGKGVVNYGVGGVASLANNVVGGLGQAMMQTVSNTDKAIKGKPLDFSEKTLKKDIYPERYGKFVDTLASKGPAGEFASGFIQGAAEGIPDPSTYLLGGIVDDLSKAGIMGKASKPSTEMVQVLGGSQQSILAKEAAKQAKQAAKVAKNSKTVVGEIGKQTPGKNIDDFIRDAQNKVDDLRYQRNELGALNTADIESAEKELLRLQREKYLPQIKEQLNTLEQRQKELFDAGEYLSPEFSELSDKTSKLKGIIDEIGGTNGGTVNVPGNNPLGDKLPTAEPKPIGGNADDAAKTGSNAPIGGKLPQTKAEPTPLGGTLPKADTPKQAALGGKSKFAQTVANSNNTVSEVADDLKKLDLGYDKVTNEQSLAQANKRIADNVEDAVRFVLNNNQPSAEHTTTAIQLINKFQNEGNYERAVDIASDISSKLTKNGQAIQAASIYDRLSPDGILLYAQRQVDKLNDSRWFKGLTKEQKINPDLAKQLKELAENMKNLTGDAKIEASQELQQVLQSLGKSTVLRKIESAQTIGQLLNPKTMGRNIISNELFYRVERLNKYIATPIDMVRSTLTGADRTITFKTGGQGGYWEGFFKGAKAGWKGVNPAGLTTQFDLSAPAFKSKWNPLTYMEKTLGATLKGFDYAAYNRAVKQTVGEMAELKAINSGLTGSARKAVVESFIQNADRNILDIADRYGKYVTFQDDNLISKGLSGVKRGLNLGKEWGAGSLVVKYPKTPGALIMRGLDYSPAGFLKSAYEIAKPLLKGGKIDTREATMALSRAITGTLGFTGMGYYLADKGVITGRTDKDQDVRELQKQTGAGSYKVNLSALQRWAMNGFNEADLEMRQGDTLYSYDWAQPIAMAISFGANINANIKENEGALDNTGATIASSLEGALGTIAEQPVLQGITRQFQGYDFGQNVTQTLKSIPSSFTPTFANQVRQYQDNTGRSTYNPDPLRSALNMAQVKIPGKSNLLPANYDTLGKQKENYQNGSNNFFNVFLNPGFVSQNNPTPVQKEILRLYETTGAKTQFPRVVDSKLTWTVKGNSNSYTLSQEEKPQYQKAVGENARIGIEELMNSDKYKNAKSDDERVKLIYNVLNDASAEAKDEFLKRKGLK